MRHVDTLIAASVISLGSLFFVGYARAGEREMERFRSEYPDALARLEKHFANVKGTGVLIVKRTEGAPKKPPTVEESAVTFAVSRGYGKATWKPAPASGRPETVYCAGPRSGFYPESIFKAERKPEGGGYVLRGVDAKGREFGEYQEVFERFLNAPFSAKGASMSYILNNDKTYQLSSASTVREEGKELIRVEFQRGGSPEKINHTALLLDPSRGWVIIRVEHKFKTLMTRSQVDYDDTSPIPTPRRVVFQEPQYGRETSFDFREFTFGETPAREYTLAYYGVPDVNRPGTVEPRDYTLPLIVGAAIVALAIAIGLRVAHSRMSRAPSS